MTDLETQEKLECCVCLDETVDVDETTDCGHAVCQGCLSLMNKPSCPMCRAPIELVGEAAERINRKEIARKRGEAYLATYGRILIRRTTNRFRHRNGRIYTVRVS